MYQGFRERHTISWHLKDLGKRDVDKVIEVANWLEKQVNKPRDIQRRVVPKRLLFRHIAAQMCMKACAGDVNAAREIMDRTEGKVADIVITGNMDDLVKSLEAGRSRLLSARQPQLAIEGEVINLPIVVNTEGSIPEDQPAVQVSKDQHEPKD
jgi:hypothetical protein